MYTVALIKASYKVFFIKLKGKQCNMCSMKKKHLKDLSDVVVINNMEIACSADATYFKLIRALPPSASQHLQTLFVL